MGGGRCDACEGECVKVLWSEEEVFAAGLDERDCGLLVYFSLEPGITDRADERVKICDIIIMKIELAIRIVGLDTSCFVAHHDRPFSTF